MRGTIPFLLSAFAFFALPMSALAEWTTTSGQDPDQVGVSATATDGRTTFSGGCNVMTERGLWGTLIGYTGDGLERLDDVSRPVIFEVRKADGTSRSFPAMMHYYAPDEAWVTHPPLSTEFMDEFGSGDVLIIRNAGGVSVVEFALAGASEARALMRDVCHM